MASFPPDLYRKDAHFAPITPHPSTRTMHWGKIDDADLLAVPFDFGRTAPTPLSPNNDGTVDDADLLTVLFNFGAGG